MYIAPHVHCRDWKQKYKGETVRHALKVAESVGVNAIFDMPNTNPAITTNILAYQRLELARRANSPVFYGLYIGLTANPEQIEEAVKTYDEFFPEVVGFKLFVARSGELGVVGEEEQDLVYGRLAELGYKGMVAAHCEKESLIKKKPDGTQDWDPNNPITHCYARPEEAEVESVRDQIRYARSNRFEGNLHVTHISAPEAVELVQEARDKIRISCGATPHHCLLDDSVMESENGVLYKVNPPLRNKKSSSGILECLRSGKIDYLETDHAPHSLEEQLNYPYMSGLPGLPFIPFILEQLRKKGFTEERIEEITYKRIVELFDIDLEERNLETGNDFSGDYAFNPWENYLKK